MGWVDENCKTARASAEMCVPVGAETRRACACIRACTQEEVGVGFVCARMPAIVRSHVVLVCACAMLLCRACVPMASACAIGAGGVSVGTRCAHVCVRLCALVSDRAGAHGDVHKSACD